MQKISVSRNSVLLSTVLVFRHTFLVLHHILLRWMMWWMLSMWCEGLPCVRLELRNVLCVEHQGALLPENSKVSNEHGKWVVFSSVYELSVPAHSKMPASPAALTTSIAFWVEFKVLLANLTAVRGPWVLLQKSKAGRMLELSAVSSWFLNSL